MNTIDRLLESLLDRLEKMEEFTLEQAPDICNEILEREKVKTKDEIVISAILSLGGILLVGLCIYFYNEAGRYDDEQKAASVIIGVICLIGSFFSLCVLADKISELRILKVSPKLTILEKLKKLMR